MKPPTFLFLVFGGGLTLAAIGLSGLRNREEGLRHHQNPFAIQQSGYGKTLARLSQNTIDVVWHLGIEQVNPLDHDHHDHDDHGHDDHGHDEHGHDDHGHDDHGHDDHGHDDHGHDDHGHDDHGHDDHGHDDHGHDDHGPAQGAPKPQPAMAGPHGWLTEAKEWMHDLGIARYHRNSPFAVTEAHQKVVAADIEKMLLRSYKMDPTDFGVYNAYFLFLTIHEFRSTPVARDHARLVSRMTVAQATRETVDPQPWLTAASATLNLFFLEQEDLRAKGQKPSIEMLEDFRRQMGHCLRQYATLRDQAKADGRWEAISEERRQDMEGRERFARMASEQFDQMLARSGAETVSTAADPGARVAGNGEESQETPETEAVR